MNKYITTALLFIGQQAFSVETFFSLGESAYHFRLEGESVFLTSRLGQYKERVNFDNMVVNGSEFINQLLRHNDAKTFQAHSEQMSFPCVLEVGARHRIDESSSISLSLSVSQPMMANIEHKLNIGATLSDAYHPSALKTYYAHATSFYEPISIDLGYSFIDDESNRFNLGVYLMDLRHVISDQIPSLSLKEIIGHAYSDRYPSFGFFASASAPLITSFDQRFSSSVYLKFKFSEGIISNSYTDEVKNVFIGLPGDNSRTLNNASVMNMGYNIDFSDLGSEPSSQVNTFKAKVQKSNMIREIPVQDLSLSMWMLSIGIEITPQMGLSYE